MTDRFWDALLTSIEESAQKEVNEGVGAPNQANAVACLTAAKVLTAIGAAIVAGLKAEHRS